MNMHAKMAPADTLDRAIRLRKLIHRIALDALKFAPNAKIDAMVRGWLTRGNFDSGDPMSLLVFADAMGFAADLSITLPSSSGSTAIDRMLHQRAPVATEEEAVASLKQLRISLLRLQSAEPGIGFLAEDIATGESLRIFEEKVPASAAGTVIATRVCPVPETDGYVLMGSIVPLDEAAQDVAKGFIRPGGKGLANPHRCLEAIYRHVLRHGGANLAGFNRPIEGSDPEKDFSRKPDDSELDSLAFAWAELPPGTEPTPESLLAARRLANLDDLVDAISASAFARDRGRDALADAYARIAVVQMETLERRATSGFGGRTPSLDAVAAEIDQLIVQGEFPAEVRALFNDLRRKVRVASAGRPDDAKLTALIQRIQALRAKTVEQGCTEEEAMAAAAKVAELLDRYGLSISELDLRQQTCEGVGIETTRRRTGPIDECIPTVAVFVDCRFWFEITQAGFVRYVFFGLPADVEAAHYLYDLIEATFVTETERFKRDAFYKQLPSNQRRSGTNSFQIGLAHGVIDKLQALRKQRETSMRSASGQDLVPIKASVVEEELEKLGMRFTTRDRHKNRSVLADAYDAGQEAGQRFEVRPGIEDGHKPKKMRR